MARSQEEVQLLLTARDETAGALEGVIEQDGGHQGEPCERHGRRSRPA